MRKSTTLVTDEIASSLRGRRILGIAQRSPAACWELLSVYEDTSTCTGKLYKES